MSHSMVSGSMLEKTQKFSHFPLHVSMQSFNESWPPIQIFSNSARLEDEAALIALVFLLFPGTGDSKPNHSPIIQEPVV